MNDISMLKKSYELECNKGTNVFWLAKKKWCDRISSGLLKYLAKELVDLDMEKSIVSIIVCKSNWKVKKLIEEQVKYACIDVYASFKIGKIMLSSEHTCNN